MPRRRLFTERICHSRSSLCAIPIGYSIYILRIPSLFTYTTGMKNESWVPTDNLLNVNTETQRSCALQLDPNRSHLNMSRYMLVSLCFSSTFLRLMQNAPVISDALIIKRNSSRTTEHQTAPHIARHYINSD